MTRENTIKIVKANGFNCFPVPKKPGQIAKEWKEGDYRFNGAETALNQHIGEDENYGIIAIDGMGTCIVDFDDKEYFREKVENIAEKYMVTESPHGFHWYIKGLTGVVKKAMLYNLERQPNKQIIDVQGPKQFCIGDGSVIDSIDEGHLEYNAIGTDVIYDAKGENFESFLDNLCKTFNVKGKERTRNQYYQMRQRFKEGKPPIPGTSNDYWFQAALYCNSEGMSREEAETEITRVFDIWRETPDYQKSLRPFSNIQTKIDDVYDNDMRINPLGGRPKGAGDSGLDKVKVVEDVLNSRKLYSDKETKILFEDKAGFLTELSGELHGELQPIYKIMTEADFKDITFKLIGLAPNIPKTDKMLFVFKNGKRHAITKELVESDELADTGFKDYNYLPKTKENEPTKWLEIMFGSIDESEHKRVKAGLKAILHPYLDSRISIIHGKSGVGKSTALSILARVLGEYSAVFELDQLNDRFNTAQLLNKRLLVLQDLPKVWKGFDVIKALTGEQWKSERGFHRDTVTFENKLKIWASANHLAKIPDLEKNPMYERRLSLIHNTREIAYSAKEDLEDEVIENEAEKIVSWIFNLTDEECGYEDAKTVQKEWERIACPEEDFVKSNYTLSEDDTDTQWLINIKKAFEEEYPTAITTLDLFKKIIQNEGYNLRVNKVFNIKRITKPKSEIDSKQGVIA